MDEIAKAIGWLVIVVSCVYAVGKLLESLESEKHTKQAAKNAVDSHEKRLALRHFYRATDDAQIHIEVKNHDAGWALLFLDLDDDKYAQKMRKEESAGAFEEAVRRFQQYGHCLVLDGKRLRWKTEAEREHVANRRA